MTSAAPLLDGASKTEDEALSLLGEDHPRTHSPLPMREIVIHHSGENGAHGIASSVDDTANEPSFGSDAYIAQVVMECFGLCAVANEQETTPGTYACLRHPEGGPMATGLAPQPSTTPFQLSPCAQCYQEEQPFAASPPSQWTLYQLVHFLQTSSSGNHNTTMDTLFHTHPPTLAPNSNDTENPITEGKAVESSPEQSLSTRILAAMSSSSQWTRCSLLQRLAQVQHWHRQTEYQQRQQYQQLVLSLQQQNLQHQATIKQLRRTIQQDCKFIKTMATQQQDVEQAILGLSNHGGNSVDVTPPPPPQGSPPKAVVTRSRSSISQSLHHVASAHVIHESLGEEEETTETTAAAADDDFLQSPPVTENNTPNPSLLPSWNNALPQRRSLRSSSSSEMIFRSFRGGLLDPPSSPPVPFKKTGGHKLTLDSDARHALQIPSRWSRSNSVAGDVPPEATMGLPNAPFSPVATAESVATPGTTDDDDEDGDAAPTTTTAAGGATVFHVTGAASRDKFGDAGLYTGPILVTEGLPHGPNGRMEYCDSGRIYEGDWMAGQWHGRGRLLNPNGDSYEGDFCLDARHGQGVYRWDNGDVYVGNFTSDKRHGQGKFCFHNGNVYEGEFLDGLFDGYGKYVFAGGSYEGHWKDGRYNGNGVLTYTATGGKYTGEFRNSVAHGFGIEILPDGRQRRGMWVDGKPTEFSEDAKPPVPAAAEEEESK